MLSEIGREFKNALTERANQVLGAKERFIAPNRPQQNGLCARRNGAIAEVLAKLLGGAVAEWDARLESALFYYNAKENSATGVSPFRAACGKECAASAYKRLQLIGGGVDGSDGDLELEPGVRDFADVLAADEVARKNLQEYIQENQGKRDARNKKNYDAEKVTTGAQINVGDLVFKKRAHLSAKMRGRIGPKWDGPYRVTAAKKTSVHIAKGNGVGEKRASFHVIKKYDDHVNA